MRFVMTEPRKIASGVTPFIGSRYAQLAIPSACSVLSLSRETRGLGGPDPISFPFPLSFELPGLDPLALDESQPVPPHPSPKIFPLPSFESRDKRVLALRLFTGDSSESRKGSISGLPKAKGDDAPGMFCGILRLVADPLLPRR